MNHSPITNKLFNDKTKKSFIKGLSAVAASAMLLTGAGCGILPSDTTDTTEIKVTSPLEEFAHVEGYVSDLANDIINDPKFEEYNKIDVSHGTYGTAINPTNYDYFRKLYPNATDEEILNYTRVHYEFYGSAENSLYVLFISHPDLSENKSGDPSRLERYLVYSLLEYPNLTKEEQRDLIKTRKEGSSVTHSLMLNKILNNKNYKVLAENICGPTKISKSMLDIAEDGLTDFTFTTSDLNKKQKLVYSLVENKDSGFYTMYFSTADIPPSEMYLQQNKSFKVENVFCTTISWTDEINKTYVYDTLVCMTRLAQETLNEYQENNITP